MVEPRFDGLIHPRTRLLLVSLLASSDSTDFAVARDQLSLSDSALSKQLSALEGAGYVVLDYAVREGRRRVRVRLTSAGRAAYEGHVAALHLILAGASPDPVS